MNAISGDLSQARRGFAVSYIDGNVTQYQDNVTDLTPHLARSYMQNFNILKRRWKEKLRTHAALLLARNTHSEER